ncbi:MAG: hypothetical protein LBV02_07810 [Bacteroidales bacterium]|jgi:hypothetical protein|nr:hypothetical protein [Bacteroidales bacterium]
MLLLILWLSITLSYSQSLQGGSTKLLGGLTNEDFFTKSDLVFDGAYLGRQAIYETTVDGKIDTIVVIDYRVFKVYKGDPSLKWQTIHVACEKSKFIFGPFLYSDTLVPFAPRPEYFKSKTVYPDYSYSMASIYFLSKSDVAGDGFPERFSADRRYDFLHDDMSRLFLFIAIELLLYYIRLQQTILKYPMLK